jgi:hypothetical protein
MAGPRQIVDGPSFAALPYGLWDAVQKPTPDGPHWQNGITWIDRCGGGDTVYEECIAVTGTGGSPTAQAAFASNVTQTNRGATSFSVYAEFDCSPVGLTDAESIARDALLKVEQWQVERAFWTGTAGKTSTGGVAQTTVYPHLAANSALSDSAGIVLQTAASTAPTGATLDVADGLGRLEGALADCYHGQGVIHISPKALPTFVANSLAVERDGALYTPAGNRLVVGAGYPGSGPDGSAAAAGTSWIYATGALFGYQSEVMMPNTVESFDRVENTYHLIAQRVYVIGWECCHLATQISLGVIVSPTV